jgi:hypothetical protein
MQNGNLGSKTSHRMSNSAALIRRFCDPRADRRLAAFQKKAANPTSRDQIGEKNFEHVS